MGNPVAPGSTNNFRSYILRVVQMCFKGFSPYYDTGEKKLPPAENLLDGLTFEILKEGYVILVQTATAGASLPPDEKYLTAARTKSTGEVVWLEEGELDGGVPTDPERVMRFSSGAQYAMFWTGKKDLFKAMWDLVKKDPVKTIAEHPFSRFEVTPHRWKRPPRILRFNESHNFKLDVLSYQLDGSNAGGVVHGVFAGGDMAGHLFGADYSAWHVFARSDAMAAMYLAELMGRVAYEKSVKNAEHWMIFEGVRNIAQYAQEQMRVPALDEGLTKFTEFGTEFKAGAWNQDYFDYAYRCAKARVPHDELFWPAIKGGHGEETWKRAAGEIWEHYKIVHPAYHGFPHVIDDQDPQKFAVNNYFNFYQYGFRNNPPPWDEHVRAARQAITNQIDILRERRQLLLADRADYARFLQETDAHLPDDMQVCTDVHHSYINLALETKYQWWNDFDIESDVFWQRLKIYADGTGTIFDKLGEILYKILDNKDYALAINALVKESVPALEKFFQKMVAFDDRFSKKTKVRREIRDGLEIEVNFKRSSFIIKQAGDPPREVGPIRFLVEEVGTVPAEDIPLNLLPSKKSRRRYKKMSG